MNILEQSTAATIKLGAFVNDTDGKTAETGLTISQADIRLSKNGGDFAQTNNATGATHDEFGYYDIPLDTTDTGTLGRLRVAVSVSGALPVWQDFLVVTANVYDTLCSTDNLDVNVTTIATDAITAASLKADAVTEIQSGLATSSALATVDGIVDDILVDTSTTLDGKLNTIDTNVDSILADTGTDGVVVASGQTVATVTNLTNLPTMPADWVTASGLKADAVTEIQSGLALEATLTAIKAKTDNLPADPAQAGEYTAAIAAVQADLDNPDQYKADVSSLAKATDLQDVEDKIDVIATDTTTEIPATLATLATSAALATVDANVDSVLADTNEIQAELADGGRTDLLIDSIVGATTATGVLLKDTAIEAIFNDVVVTGTYTFAELLKIMAAALAGKLSGGGSTTLKFEGVDGASDVIVATVDANGNRSAVTLTV